MFASPPHTTSIKFLGTILSRNSLRAVNDAIVLLAVHCHVGHKNANRVGALDRCHALLLNVGNWLSRYMKSYVSRMNIYANSSCFGTNGSRIRILEHFLNFYGIRRLTTLVTGARHLFVLWGERIQTTLTHTTYMTRFNIILQRWANTVKHFVTCTALNM
jgi:hypothetical protein